MKFSSFVNFSSVVLITIVCLLFSVTAHAQGIPTSSNGITLSASTDNPVPGETVTITAASYSFDINSATVSWDLDGKKTQKGIGLTTYTVIAPALGKKSTINISATTPEGTKYTESLVLGSGSIDVIVESDGYTPPFFKGKYPLVFQNVVTVTAIPHLANSAGKEYDPATLVYNWKKDDGTVLQDQSGYGKQSISLEGSIVPRPYYLIVTAGTRDGSAQAQTLAQVSAKAPSVVFYNNDPLYGPMFNNALSNSLRIGVQKEVSIFAGLFGFNFSKSIADDLGISWMINNVEHKELASSKSINLRSPDGISGTSNIQLSVRGVNNILQSADATFSASFEATKASTQSSAAVTF